MPHNAEQKVLVKLAHDQVPNRLQGPPEPGSPLASVAFKKFRGRTLHMWRHILPKQVSKAASQKFHLLPLVLRMLSVSLGEGGLGWRASPGPVSAHGEAGTVRPSAPTGGAPPDPARPGGPRSLQAAEPSAAPDAVQAGRTTAPPEPPARGPARHSDGPSTPPGPAEGARPQCAAAEGGPGPDPLALRSRRGGLAAAVD